MEQKDALELLRKFREGTATAEEKAILDTWYLQWKKDENFDLTEADFAAAEQAMFEKLPQPQPAKTRTIWPRVAAAATIIAALAFGLYFYQQHKNITEQITSMQHDRLPGGNKAILTLANGKTIVLTGAQNGKLAQQGTTVIRKTADGEVVYNAGSTTNDQTAALEYNTMRTPNGGEYHLVLADGTNVWLNAASSIRYPTVFKGAQRKVEITGEAYFEVTHNPTQPFKVTSNGQTVEVLGTHFNINAYPDEPGIKTTLLEGSVKISKGAEAAMLRPGQQATTPFADGGNIKVSEVDVDEVTAWKNGLFSYKRADIHTVMRQLARWYDVDVAYEGTTPVAKITGKVHRNVNALQALKILSYLDIHYKIEGKKIIITP